MQPELLQALEANVAATRQAIDESSSLAELDTQFHNLIAEASQNRDPARVQAAATPFFARSFLFLVTQTVLPLEL